LRLSGEGQGPHARGGAQGRRRAAGTLSAAARPFRPRSFRRGAGTGFRPARSQPQNSVVGWAKRADRRAVPPSIKNTIIIVGGHAGSATLRPLSPPYAHLTENLRMLRTTPPGEDGVNNLAQHSDLYQRALDAATPGSSPGAGAAPERVFHGEVDYLHLI